VNTPADAALDPQFRERGFWVQAEHPVTGRQTYPGAPVQVGEGSWQVRRPAPLLGQHNAEVFGLELGRSEHEIRTLAENGVI
jgi:crotonobetainyl-CoA:carnitine CoA-transferase CaiB-like acyl-CoA transferase